MKHLKKKIKLLLPITSLLILCFNYDICEYFYSNDVKKWWHLKVDLYALIICLLFVYSSIKKKGFTRLVLDICVGISASNVVDRFFYNVREFTNSDIIMIIITLGFAFYNFYKWKLTKNSY